MSKVVLCKAVREMGWVQIKRTSLGAWKWH